MIVEKFAGSTRKQSDTQLVRSWSTLLKNTILNFNWSNCKLHIAVFKLFSIEWALINLMAVLYFMNSIGLTGSNSKIKTSCFEGAVTLQKVRFTAASFTTYTCGRSLFGLHWIMLCCNYHEQCDKDTGRNSEHLGFWTVCAFSFSFSVASVIYLNCMSVTWTARIQIVLTFSKLLAICIIIVPGMYQLFKGKTLSSSLPSPPLISSINTTLESQPPQKFNQHDFLIPTNNMLCKYCHEILQAVVHSCSQQATTQPFYTVPTAGSTMRPWITAHLSAKGPHFAAKA